MPSIRRPGSAVMPDSVWANIALTPPVRVKHVAPGELTTDHVIVDIYGVQHAIERISYYDSVSGHSCVGAISANGWAETYRVDRDVATVVDDQPPPTDEPRRREACEFVLAV